MSPYMPEDNIMLIWKEVTVTKYYWAIDVSQDPTQICIMEDVPCLSSCLEMIFSKPLKLYDDVITLP